jgi:hypothetical protein
MCCGMEDASYQAEHNLSGPLVFHSGTELRKLFEQVQKGDACAKMSGGVKKL